MVFFLLPWSSRQSRINTVNRDLWEVENRFRGLDPLRRSLISEFGVKTKPLAPVWRRYRGKFWEELCLWALPGRVVSEIEEKGLVLSPLFGVLGVGDAIPEYPVRWEWKFNGSDLLSFWRRHLEGVIGDLLRGSVVFDFAGSRERSVIKLPEDCIRVLFEYYRAGNRVRNSLAHRAYTLRYIVEMGVGLDDLGRINFLDYRVKEISQNGNTVKVVMEGEGRYI
ncbi:MAG: peroxide stress protein YaaA [Aquificota bacterium]|nr:peroxide stress protein YaaA [Aquificota bacterium]